MDRRARSLGTGLGHTASRVSALVTGELLSDETFREAITQHVHGRDRVTLFPAEWRLGYHRLHTVGRKPPRLGFGHSGYGGSGAWGEPERKMSFAMTRNFGMGSVMGDYTLFKLSTLALECAR